MNLDDAALTRNTDGEAKLTKVLKTVENWHNETHAGVFRFCDEQPCSALAHLDPPS